MKTKTSDLDILFYVYLVTYVVTISDVHILVGMDLIIFFLYKNKKSTYRAKREIREI